MKNFIWFIKKMFQIMPQVWEVRGDKNTIIFVAGINDRKQYLRFQKKLLKIIPKGDLEVCRARK